MTNGDSVQNSSELAKLATLADACVACGLCAPACPTYALEASEAQSPRGRIHLVRAISLGSVQPDASTKDALDGCVGCGSCEAICPAQVRFLDLMDGVRAVIAPKKSWRGDLVSAVLHRPALHQTLLRLPAARIAAGLLGFSDMLASGKRNSLQSANAPQSHEGPSIVFSAGCANASIQSDLLAACELFANALGFVARIEQSCCGAFDLHRGQGPSPKSLGRFTDAFADCDLVVGLTPGCHSQHQRYLGNRYLDLSHWLYRHLDQWQWLPGPRQRVALHTPCSVRYPVQGTNHWQQLLQKVSGPEWLPLSDSLSCCGAGGSYRFDQPKRSAALGTRMAQAILGKTPDLVVSANVGCLQQISSHLKSASIPVEHPAVFLARYLKRSK